MNADTPQAATPPQPGSAEHWAAWLDRYGNDYATHDERRAAYQDFQTNLATMQAVFSQPDRMHTDGYLAAHERAADGDADSPDDAELWVPAQSQRPRAGGLARRIPLALRTLTRWHR